jgi:hypothetical protein
MFFFPKTLWTVTVGLVLLSSATVTDAQNKIKNRDDATAEALRDLQVGMWETSSTTILSSTIDLGRSTSIADDCCRRRFSNTDIMIRHHPTNLCATTYFAQQDPELMAEAKKMAENPQWQKKMKELSNSKEFKESIKKSKELLKDPDTAAHAEAKLEHMVKVGNDQLKKGAASAMEEAMAAMANPETMAEMAKMMKDPSFAKQLESMTKDPQFQSYIEAVRSYHFLCRMKPASDWQIAKF